MNRKDFLKISSVGSLGLMIGFPTIGNAFNAEELASGNSFDVVIVGTGYGSSVTALRLAQAGKRCLMLEMGLDWSKSGLKFSSVAFAEKHSTWLKNTTIAPFANFIYFEKFTGALDRIDFDNVKVYAGRGVGGGSLVNGGMSVTPRRDYFEEIFPQLDADKFYNTYFPKANNGLGVTTIPEDYYQSSEYYQFSRTGEEEGIAAGYRPVRVPNVYDYDYMQKEEAGQVPKSALAGEVLYGNNYGKKDLTKTYLKEALATGNVTVLGLHKVEQIFEKDNDTYTIEVSQINTKGNVVDRKTYTTNKLFLGAGSLGTTELLLKSEAKGTLTKLDDQIGKYWGNNGNTMATRSCLKKPLGGKQSSMPAAGLEKWSTNDDAVFAEIAPFPIGIDFRIALYLIINRVPNYGSFTYDLENEKLALDWGDEQNAHMVRNAGNFLDEMNEVNGGSRGSTFPDGIDPTICYHPLGGAVIGKATDMYGRLNNYKGIYITDGALIPASIGVNPYVTITALAEYCVENVIENDFDTDDVSIEEDSVSIKVFPVPFRNEVTVDYQTIRSQEVTFEIYNHYGFKLLRRRTWANSGENSYTIRGLWWLTKGVYILKVSLDGKVISKTISK